LQLYGRYFAGILETEFAMETENWAEEMTTTFQTETYSSGAVTALPLMRGPQLVSRMAELIQTLAVVLGVLGVVTNILVLVGMCFAGRSKLNASSAFIANHTTLEQPVFSTLMFFS